VRFTILQFGDYGDAYRRFQSGGAETYRDQRHSVNFIASLTPGHQVTNVSVCDRIHDEELSPGLRSIGVPPDLISDRSRLWPLLDRFTPEAFILRTRSRVALAWAAERRVPALPTFAELFTNSGLRARLNNWRIGRVIRRCVKPCVANHSLSASQSLRRIGLAPEEIVAWEHLRIEPMQEAKDFPRPGRPFRLFFAGTLSESKGVGDCIEALALARKTNANVDLTLAGAGNSDRWFALAERRGVETSVRLLGVIALERVLTEMRDSDSVVVPSRHDCPEGLPNTIFEALASRSPLIASDHPAFAERLRPEVDSLRFKAGHPQALAEQVVRLTREPGLYARLSRESASALSRLYVGIEWSDLIARFVEDPLSNSGWVNRCTLAARLNGSGAASP
jgi:glycosyltransferase involved in cell wall biosynthesis